MERWSFLTNHARALLCIAHDPGIRLRDIADALGVTERSAYGIVTDLAGAGYMVKEKDGRRNRYQIQAHLPLGTPLAESEPSVRSWAAWWTPTLAVAAEEGHDDLAPTCVKERP